jgi:phosphate transport system ATP-binding protein
MTTQNVTIPVDVGPVEIAQERKAPAPAQREVVFDIRDLAVNYGPTTAVSGVTLEIYKNYITAMIGPSGCGKSTFIRCLNRMNDLIPGAQIDGQVLYQGQDIYGDGVDLSRFAAELEWSSSARIRFRNRSTTTWRGGRACSG